MDEAGVRRAFEEKLAKARRESLDPREAHWSAGFLASAKDRVARLIACGALTGFSECEAGASGRRVPGREQAVFKDGTGLVALAAGAPWECARFAESRLSSGEELWLCLRLRAAPGRWSNAGPHFWCSCLAKEGRWAGPEEFWEDMSMEVARAQAAMAAGEPPTLEICMRLDSLAEREQLAPAAAPAAIGSGPSRL